MTVTAAVIDTGQGQDIVVLIVKNWVLSSPDAREEHVATAEAHFGVRAILMGENLSTWGDTDIVRWIDGTPYEAMPWAEYRLTTTA